jgi:hypothetical protein
MGLFSCGSQSSSLLEEDILEPPRNPIVLMLSGWNTCWPSKETWSLSPFGMGTYDLAKDLVENLETKFDDVPYIFTCFQFQKSWDGHKARAITSETGNEVSLFSLEELASATIELKEKYNSNQIIIIGHSQGASLGMELVSVLPDDIQAKVLITLDPISREKCNYWVMAGAFVTFDPFEECTQFPSEISNFTQEMIRAKLNKDKGMWENWYQQDFSFLHSGEAGYADKNVEVIYDGWDIFAHQYVYASEEVWQRVHNLVGTQLGLQFQVSRNLYPRI